MQDCTYSTSDTSEAVACALLAAHSPTHMARLSQPSGAAHGPRLERPKVDVGVTPEQWNVFQRRWDVFVAGSGLNPNDSSAQLFQCAGETLGDSLLKTDPRLFTKPTADVMAAMKSLAVVAVATGVSRAELMILHQERDEPFRSFSARVRGKAETCDYSSKCTCLRNVDFTDIIIRDVLIAGIADLDIRRETLGTDNILDRSVNEVVGLVESKEMARNSLPSSSTTAGISTFKRGKSITAPVPAPQPWKTPAPNRSQTAVCPECKIQFAQFSEGPRGWNTQPHYKCRSCYRASRGRSSHTSGAQSGIAGVGSVFSQVSSVNPSSHDQRGKQLSQKTIGLGHHIFSKGEWHKARVLDHPEIELTASVMAKDYRSFGRKCPQVNPVKISVMADSGAQSCLWSLSGFLAAGFQQSDLIPVSQVLVAANKSPITIAGAILLRLQGAKYSCATMVYISKDAQKFFLSCEAMVDLGIISPDFPSGGIATVSEATSPSFDRPSASRVLNAGCAAISTEGLAQCSCPQRTVVPDRPQHLPFECCPANNSKMKEWLMNRFASSTFNTCPHRPLPCMIGPPIEIHMREDAVPKAVHTPVPVAVHWQKKVEADLLRDEMLGVIERVPFGEPTMWCHRMVVTRKQNGNPRRTVDLSPLNKHCKRETFASESPFQLARRVPKATWKTVTDAWNGYHSVPLRESDRHLTTFVTPYGMWRYKRAPQGFLSSGDGYNRRFDAILANFERKERCVDDTIHYDDDLQAHWWRTIDLLVQVGQAGIVLNPEKFCFAQKTIDFAGFRISDSSIEPLPKYLDAIRDFPTPKSTTDIRSWFGLVNQVANYAQLREIMAPFRPFLSPKCHFQWTPDLESAFIASKSSIVAAIRHGVEIFDLTRQTCLRPDWSCQGIGYFLLQKHCDCLSQIPDCCTDGWQITLAGSRFLLPAEQRYAPIEGEALAVAWGLEQSKYFTQGCDNLVVVTDHKPLVKILGDRTLDEIPNTRLFRLKQRTLPWKFDIAHLPGKTNSAADATSRHPSPSTKDTNDDAECVMAAAIRHDAHTVTELSWEHIAAETASDTIMSQLLTAITEDFPKTYQSANKGINAFWQYRNSLVISDGVILYQDRVVIPPSLRKNVLGVLHSAHQGVSAMESRARAIVFWPGMTDDIQSVRDQCTSCNRTAPSQAATPSIKSAIPSTPFEAIFVDFFSYGGSHYLVAGCRLSGWVEIFQAPSGTTQAGAQGLIAALRSLFATFGVPEEMASDGGPEFSASATATFLARWGVHHRISSAYFAQSNGRAEVAVKKAKRLLMDNVGPTGSLNNDGLLQALLQVCNTPDSDCNISPAEIVFGRPLRDTFSFVSHQAKFRNPSIRPTWREAWSLKECAMRARFTRSSDSLDLHARPLACLSLGDHVLIQNQHGQYPTKWDRSGIIVELGKNDQYLVKVDGAGRLTLRNRRFLRRYTPSSTSIGKPVQHQRVSPSTAVCEPVLPLYSDTLKVDSCPDLDIETTPTSCDLNDPIFTPNSTPTSVAASPTTPALSDGRQPRQRQAPRQYIPETGQWE